MPIILISGPANAGKAQLLLESFEAQQRRGERPLLVVPRRADVDHYRRELAARGVMLGGRVERFAGLVSELVRRAELDGQEPLRAFAREQVLASVARSTPPGPLHAVRETPGFHRALGRLVAELESRHLSPARLRAILTDGQGAALCALYERYQTALTRIARTDRELLTISALDVLRREPDRWGGRPVLLYGFDDLTALELDVIETLGRVVDAEVTVSLAYEAGRAAFAGRAGSLQRLLPLASEHRSLPASPAHYGSRAGALHHLERSLFEPRAQPGVAGSAVRLLEGGSERAELELVAGEVKALLEEGMPAEQIALVHRSPGALAGLIEEVLRGFGIAHSLERPVPFSRSAIGRALIGALRVALAAEREPVDGLLAWLRCPGVLERPELADQLEAQLRLREIADAATARALWEAERWPLDVIERLSEAARAGILPLIERTEHELTRLFTAPRRGCATVLAAEELGEARAFAAARQALAELRELASAEDSLVGAPLDLVSALERLAFDAGQPPGEGLVVVLDPLALRARRVRALFLCGLQEGVFPALARPEPLLGERERGRLAQLTGLASGAHGERLQDERFLLYATVSRPSDLLVLSWHCARDDGSPATASPFIEDVLECFGEDLLATRRRRGLGAAGWPGPGPAIERWKDVEAILAAPRAPVARLGRLDAQELPAELAADRIWSASSLELWVRCPAGWLVERLLRPEILEPRPEALTRGSLAHAALRDALEALRVQTGSARPRPAILARARKLLREALARHELETPAANSPERLPGARRRLQADLERYLEQACVQDHALEPTHLELPFGFPDEERSLPACELAGGLRLRGRIDRVDLAPCGEAVLYDYKSKLAPLPERWMADGRVQVGLYMLALRQLLGTPVVGGFYQPLSGRDLRPRGVLSSEADIELDCVRGDERSEAELEQLLGDVLEVARQAAEEAAAGAVEPRPATCSPGGRCRYPTICRCAR